MPPKRRQPRRRGEGLTEYHREFLRSGQLWDHFRLGHINDPLLTEDEWREAWEELRDDILPAWIEARPGTRPFAWWRFDAPERRRCTNGVHPFDDPLQREKLDALVRKHPCGCGALAYELNFGVPRLTTWTAAYETEGEYLLRLGLLTDAELSEGLGLTGP
jgi:hypothetical protein